MKVRIEPSKNKGNAIVIPPSKSLAHRLIIAACLSKEESIISNVDYSKDIIATINAMRTIGASIIETGSTLTIIGNPDFKHPIKKVDCNESGSTLRFLIPLLSLSNQPVEFCGQGRLLSRPQDVYQQLFAQDKALFKHTSESILVHGALVGGHYIVRGDISSQFITGLLFALPLLKQDSTIEILEPFESKSYVDLTLDVLKTFKIEVQQKGNIITIAGNQCYRGTKAVVEGDFSQLAFFAGLGLINQETEVRGLNPNSLQGDKAILKIIEDFNGQYECLEDGYRFYPSKLQGTTVDLQDCPDLGPMVMALAAIASGKTHIINALRLRIKESDRIQAMEDELQKLGVEISSLPDEVFIVGNQTLKGNQALNGHNDHRIVMALSILSTICINSNVINDAQAITKSYPRFFDDLKKLAIEVTYED